MRSAAGRVPTGRTPARRRMLRHELAAGMAPRGGSRRGGRTRTATCSAARATGTTSGSASHLDYRAAGREVRRRAWRRCGDRGRHARRVRRRGRLPRRGSWLHRQPARSAWYERGARRASSSSTSSRGRRSRAGRRAARRRDGIVGLRARRARLRGQRRPRRERRRCTGRADALVEAAAADPSHPGRSTARSRSRRDRRARSTSSPVRATSIPGRVRLAIDVACPRRASGWTTCRCSRSASSPVQPAGARRSSERGRGRALLSAEIAVARPAGRRARRPAPVTTRASSPRPVSTLGCCSFAVSTAVSAIHPTSSPRRMTSRSPWTFSPAPYGVWRPSARARRRSSRGSLVAR